MTRATFVRTSVAAFASLLRLPSFSRAAAVQQGSAAAHPVAATTGAAMGTALSTFLNTLAPGATKLVGLVNDWLANKLSSKQQAQATTKGKQTLDPQVKAATDNLQSVATTMKVTAIVMSHATNIALEVGSMVATLQATPDKSKLSFPELSAHWDNVKGEITLMTDDQTLKDAKADINDVSVSAALTQLNTDLHGPVSTVSDNLKASGDLDLLNKKLQAIDSSARAFSNLGVALLASMAASMQTSINSSKGASGTSDLDKMLDGAASDANKALMHAQA